MNLNGDLNNSDLSLGLKTEFSAGYTSNTWFGGVLTNYTSWSLQNSNRDFTKNQFFVEFFIGYRIKAPKLLTKLF